MVSIQSLILVEQPYFNEPGYESTINTPDGRTRSQSYNEERYSSTIMYAMCDMITNPPNGFEEVIKEHFAMKKDEIINKTLIWQDKAVKHGKAIENARNELLKMFEKI